MAREDHQVKYSGQGDPAAEKPTEDLLLEHRVLKFLLPKHLARLLASPEQVGHHDFGGPVRHVLADLVVLERELVRHLVREALELSELNAVGVDAVACHLLLGEGD